MRFGAIRTLAIIGLIGLAATGAHAAAITYSGYSVLNNQTVTISDAKLGINAEMGGSGEIDLLGTNTPGGSLFTWCVDIAHDLLWSGQFPTEYFLTGLFENEVNALLTNGVPRLGSDTNVSSALQVAIWKEEYGADLTVTAPSAVTSLANTYLTNVANGTWKADPSTLALVLNGNGANQSQTMLVPVTEPASLVILGSGLAAFGLLRRRSRGAPAAPTRDPS